MRWRSAVPLIVAAAVFGCSRDRNVSERATAEISDSLETAPDSAGAMASVDPHAAHSDAVTQATEPIAGHEQHGTSVPAAPVAAAALEHADHVVPPTSTSTGQVAAATPDAAHAAHAEPRSAGGAVPTDTAHAMHDVGVTQPGAPSPVPSDTAHAAHAGEPAPAAAIEQHAHPSPDAPTQPIAMGHDMAMDHGTPMSQGGAMGPMLGVLDIPMDRMGSGTTWIPDAVTLPSRHWMTGGWDVMLHGFGFLQYNRQGGPRGDDQLGSVNWAMLMAGRPVGAGTLQLRAMLSLDAATVTARGYPLLLQTGEVFEGEPIADRQHPHDFWMELGALYERPVGPIGLSLYAAPSGEPALGPVAFMHRPSAMDDPVAPLAHHWLDATHISFGVVTLGVFQKRWKVEGSLFNGREPDEHRWDLEPDRLDSYSGRVTLNPSASWSMSVGLGRLENPETMHPTEDVRRVTASVLYGRPLANGQWASTLAWGANTHLEEGTTLHGAVLESEAVLDDRHTLFGRIDFAQKTAGDLGLDEADGFDHDRRFDVGALSVGFIRELGRAFGLTGGLGVRGTVSLVPEELRRSYGSRAPMAGLLFFRVRPPRPPATAEPMR